MSTSPRGDLLLGSGRSERVVCLDACLTPDAVERAETGANAWIKRLRLARVDGEAFRDRFRLRGDSLWWFAELYLHKRRVVARAFRAMEAFDALMAEGTPAWVRPLAADPVVHVVASEVARRRGFRCEGGAPATLVRARLAERLKASFHTAVAAADRLRPGRASPSPHAPHPVVAFVHSAFWSRDRGEESYLGPLLACLERKRPGGVQLVGVGPRTNFRVRRWRDRFVEFGDPQARGLPFTPVEAWAGWRALTEARRIWRERGRHREALEASGDIRAQATVHDVDLWPLIRAELAGIAELQFPWSARAMDEAAAALDHLEPSVAVTYAEAGGWGRAIMLEARRRSVPSVGVQHGFIYRHWLNYLHEPDEMQPSPGNPADAGFPRPTRTLLFDGFAAEHLVTEGSFPPESLVVTGSPRLERFVTMAAATSETDRIAIRREAGVPDGRHMVLVAAKHAQLGAWFHALVVAARDVADVVLVVKPHPAESDEPYLRDAAGASAVVIAPPSADLARLTTAARAIVTANSTAAIEAMAIDVPALIVGLPNNLSPFVDAGAMLGVTVAGDLSSALARLTGDRSVRLALARAQRGFIARYRIVQPAGAAERAAEAVSALAID